MPNHEQPATFDQNGEGAQLSRELKPLMEDLVRMQAIDRPKAIELGKMEPGNAVIALRAILIEKQKATKRLNDSTIAQVNSLAPIAGVAWLKENGIRYDFLKWQQEDGLVNWQTAKKLESLSPFEAHRWLSDNKQRHVNLGRLVELGVLRDPAAITNLKKIPPRLALRKMQEFYENSQKINADNELELALRKTGDSDHSQDKVAGL